jgi:hypothetical protein
MNHSSRPRRLLVIGLALAGACSTRPADAPPAARQAGAAPISTPAGAAITEAQVLGATITGVFAAPAVFLNGAHEGAPFVPGGAARPRATMMTPLMRFGELDGVPGTDAAVVIASSEGGSGERITLAIVGLRNDAATSVATVAVGDRSKVRDVRVTGRDITLDLVEIGPGEAACCGTQLATRTYRVDGSTLAQQTSQVTGTLSLAATVAGHTWTAVAIDGEPLASGGTAPTLTVAEGQISGTSGCNQYRGPIVEPTPGMLRIGPKPAHAAPAKEPPARPKHAF